MKVRELQEKLSRLDPDLEVVCYSEDENLLDKGRGVIVFDVLDVTKTDAELGRFDDQTPYLKFCKSDTSMTIATLEVTSDC